MTEIDFHFDPISPYAWLAFERLPQVLEGLSYSVSYRPLLFAGLLQHWGQKGPAEIEPKRAWTFRQVSWLAHRHGIRLDTPAIHPFNPLALLRLLIACAPEGGTPNRWQCELVFQHVWHGGADPNDPDRLQALQQRLGPQRDPQSSEVKQALRGATEAALAHGLFGVPTLVAQDRVYWGLDGLEMMAAGLRRDPWFDSGAWEAEGAPRPGLQRQG
jgi:2-hydroxychromene-2-carboxylate isomerase